jgi:hypothetical protein
MPPTRIDYGADLLGGYGERQPTGSIHVDAFGLAQAQLTYAIDSSAANITDVLDAVQMGIAYPDDIGFPMTSYKYAISSNKGGVAMLTIDFMGVARGIGYTDAQITGVASTTAQPIETHPAFTNASGPHAAFGGTPDAPLNNAIFVQAPAQPNGGIQFSFAGFGVTQSGATNIKAGIRQYLRPMLNVRGQIFFNAENAARSAALVNNIGKTIFNSGDLFKLITPNDAVGALSPEICLMTAANVESIGQPDNVAGIKVTYDIMVGGDIGWDQEVYWPATASIFA